MCHATRNSSSIVVESRGSSGLLCRECVSGRKMSPRIWWVIMHGPSVFYIPEELSYSSYCARLLLSRIVNKCQTICRCIILSISIMTCIEVSKAHCYYTGLGFYKCKGITHYLVKEPRSWHDEPTE